MKKIKINLANGTSLEKPLVTAFKSSTGDYVVLDNEMNGTMGLPIILVTKLENNSLNGIPDAEWNVVKESLRLIISGNHTDYIDVVDNISAGDNFFKQLTLPVASFETLKNNYRPVVVNPNPVEMGGNVSAADASFNNVNPVNGVANNNMGPMNVAPDNVMASNVLSNASAGVSPVMPNPMETQAVSPVMNNMVNESPVVNSVMDNTQVQNQNINPVMPSAPVESQTVSTVAPVEAQPLENVMPVENPVESVPVDFTADKEAFLKACENMFDALVAKFNNK